MSFITVRALDTYHEVTGTGPPLMLLHGGFCSLDSMRSHIGALSARFRVHAVERSGHGRTRDRPGPYSYDEMVLDTLGQMDVLGLASAHLVGFSDGAIVSLMIAIEHPERVRSLVIVSANLDPDGLAGDDGPPGEDHLNPEDKEIELRLRDQHAALSPDGADHTNVVIEKLLDLWRSEPHIPEAALAAVRAPTLVMAADRDVVRSDHSRLIARSIPGAQLCILPGVTHMKLLEGSDLVNEIVGRFHAGLPGFLRQDEHRASPDDRFPR